MSNDPELTLLLSTHSSGQPWQLQCMHHFQTATRSGSLLNKGIESIPAWYQCPAASAGCMLATAALWPSVVFAAILCLCSIQCPEVERDLVRARGYKASNRYIEAIDCCNSLGGGMANSMAGISVMVCCTLQLVSPQIAVLMLQWCLKDSSHHQPLDQ